MAAYITCFGCSENKDECARRAEIKEAIAGLSATSIKFKCDIRQPYFLTGQRVKVSLPAYGNKSENYDDLYDVAEYHGTVIRERKKPGSFKVKLDDGLSVCGDYGPMPDASNSGTGYVAVIAKYITRIDEPCQKVCLDCEAVGGGHEDGYICHFKARFGDAEAMG